FVNTRIEQILQLAHAFGVELDLAFSPFAALVLALEGRIDFGQANLATGLDRKLLAIIHLSLQWFSLIHAPPWGGNCEGAVAICCGCPERKGGRAAIGVGLMATIMTLLSPCTRRSTPKIGPRPQKTLARSRSIGTFLSRSCPPSGLARDLSGSQRRFQTGRLPARGTVAPRARNSALEDS